MSVTIFKGLENFTNFLWTWISQGRPLVAQETANERASICAQCHNNVNVDQSVKTGCCGSGAGAVINSLVKKIIQDRKTPSDNQLKSCGLCGCYLRTKVWIPVEAMGLVKEDTNAWPSFCWIKSDLDQLP